MNPLLTSPISRIILLLIVLASVTVNTDAAQTDSMKTLVDLLIQKGVVTEIEGNNLILNHQSSASAVHQEQKIITIIPQGDEYLDKIAANVAKNIKEEVKRELKKDIRRGLRNPNLNKDGDPSFITGMMQRIRWNGDIRLRHQSDFFSEGNGMLVSQDLDEVINTTNNRHRERYRLRLGATAKVADNVDVGVRIATGNAGDPVSTNDTFGDYLANDNIVLDQAYLSWTYAPDLRLVHPRFKLVGGRMPNPFFSTDLVWDKDLNFEGLALNIERNNSEHFNLWCTMGLFPLHELEMSQNDAWFMGMQLGLHWKIFKTFSTNLAAACYDFKNVQAPEYNKFIDNPYSYTEPLFVQKGNTYQGYKLVDEGGNLLAEKYFHASDYKEVNFLWTMDVGFFDPIHINFLAEYVSNIGFDREELIARGALQSSDPDNLDKGYQLGVRVGHEKMREFLDWNGYCYYKHLEGDAVMDAFTDSDFHLGGTNAKGWILGGNLGLTKNTWLSARWLTADELDGIPLGVDVLQVDINARF